MSISGRFAKRESIVKEYVESSESETSFDNRVLLKSKPSIGGARHPSKIYSTVLTQGGVIRNWAEVSRINYVASQRYDTTRFIPGRKSISAVHQKDSSIFDIGKEHTEEPVMAQTVFPTRVTSLLNEDQLWGCFYVFPELYDDKYSPVVQVVPPDKVTSVTDGILTKEIIAVSLSYLKRTPILGDYVFIKCDLSYKNLCNIDVLRDYKYLVYLNLSSNFLSDLRVLSYLPYLQHLTLCHNRLNNVLDYDTPQWFLTEVYYKYNSVKEIKDLTLFWSLVILDLSHNNIKQISGMENLKFLRRLDLSFNHIQKIENLNNLGIVWLDLSYNNISSFEFDNLSGLWTLLELEYLNLNENSLISMKVFVGCTRLRELHARNNQFNALLELAIYMRQLRKLTVLDFRANDVCNVEGYREVVISTFPMLLSLDAEEIDPVNQRESKMESEPEIVMVANRRLLRLMYVEHLSRAKLSPLVPPADTTLLPLVVLVGYEAVGKGTLARRLARECKNVELGLLHTTAEYHFPEHYIPITRRKFDELLLSGNFLTYNELFGQSYGLSREQGYINHGKIKIVCMDLVSALILRLRGLRPILILARCENRSRQKKREDERKEYRFKISLKEENYSCDRTDKSTLQCVVSGNILVAGIINELFNLVTEHDADNQEKFVLDSECSLFMDSQLRSVPKNFERSTMLSTLMKTRSSLNIPYNHEKKIKEYGPEFGEFKQQLSIASLYTEVVEDDLNLSNQQIRRSMERTKKNSKPSTLGSPSISYQKSTTENSKNGANTKISKSVTFTGAHDAQVTESDLSGMLIEPLEPDKVFAPVKLPKSISAKLDAYRSPHVSNISSDNDLWLAFLAATHVANISETAVSEKSEPLRILTPDNKADDPDFIFQQLGYYRRFPSAGKMMKLQDDYEDMHRENPGLFWDTITMDDPQAAFVKMKKILKNIVESQTFIGPMFDIDFINMDNYPTVQKRLQAVFDQLAPQRLFY